MIRRTDRPRAGHVHGVDTAFDETKHPRRADGTFAPKQNSAPGGVLHSTVAIPGVQVLGSCDACGDKVTEEHEHRTFYEEGLLYHEECYEQVIADDEAYWRARWEAGGRAAYLARKRQGTDAVDAALERADTLREQAEYGGR